MPVSQNLQCIMVIYNVWEKDTFLKIFEDCILYFMIEVLRNVLLNVALPIYFQRILGKYKSDNVISSLSILSLKKKKNPNSLACGLLSQLSHLGPCQHSSQMFLRLAEALKLNPLGILLQCWFCFSTIGVGLRLCISSDAYSQMMPSLLIQDHTFD